MVIYIRYVIILFYSMTDKNKTISHIDFKVIDIIGKNHISKPQKLLCPAIEVLTSQNTDLITHKCSAF